MGAARKRQVMRAGHTEGCRCYRCLTAEERRTLGRPTCEADAAIRHLRPITRHTRVIAVLTIQDGRVTSARLESWSAAKARGES